MTNKQIIKTSRGCPYGCSFCFNGKKPFEGLPTPKIRSNNIILHDDAFLSKSDVLDVIEFFGEQRVNNKVVYYEILQGINVIDLTQEIANSLYKNRFKKIRIAWDGSYSKKNMQVVFDGIKYLLNAGYKRKDLICYILSNYYVSLTECIYKAKLMLFHHIPICNCIYRKNYLDPKIYPEHWTNKEIDYFKQECRMNNQIIKFNGYDPEIRKRLIVKKPMA